VAARILKFFGVLMKKPPENVVLQEEMEKDFDIEIRKMSAQRKKEQYDNSRHKQQ